MSALTDFVGASASAAPDAGASLLQRVYSTRGFWDYRPVAALAAGKYVVKSTAKSRGILRVASSSGVGVEIRGMETEAVLDLPSSTAAIHVDYESMDVEPVFQARTLPQFWPSPLLFTSSPAPDTLSAYAVGRMLAADPTNVTQVSVGAYGGQISVSKDSGISWHRLGTFDTLSNYTSNSPGETHSVEYFQNRFIVAGGPTTSQTYPMYSINGFDWYWLSDTNLTNIKCSAVSSNTGTYVGIKHATSSQLIYSLDGQSWTTATSPSGFSAGNGLFVFWDGTQFIATNEGSQLTTSVDGINWTTGVTLAFSIRNMVRIGSTYYAISTAGAFFSSTNLTSWTSGPVLSTSSRGNHRLIASGSTLVYYDPVNFLVRTSVDGGANWITRLNSGTDAVNQYGTLQVDAAGKIWYYQNGSMATWSTNGINWSRALTSISTQLGGTNQPSNTIAFGAGIWALARTNGTIQTSPDRVTWTLRSVTGVSISTSQFNELQFANGIFMGVTNTGGIVTSSDGLTWTGRHYNGTANGVGTGNISCVAFGNSIWAVANTSGQIYTSADNGLTWTARQNLSVNIQEITFANNLWVAVGANSNIWTSTDAITWTQRLSNTIGSALQNIGTNTFTGVAFGNGIWVAVGGTGSIATSTNGTTWTGNVKSNSHTNPWYLQNGSYTRVRFLGGKFVLCGSSTHIATSTDGLEWLSSSPGRNSVSIQDVAYDGTSWFGYASGSDCMPNFSTDAIVWITQDSYTLFNPSSSFSASYVNNKYVIFNNAGIYRTADWVVFEEPYFQQTFAYNTMLYEAVVGNGVLLARGTRSTTAGTPVYTTNGLQWGTSQKQIARDDLRQDDIDFGEGRFWKYFSTTGTVSYSVDGKVWVNHYTFPKNVILGSYIPNRMKKLTNGWVFWHTSAYAFLFIRELVRNPRGWHEYRLLNTSDQIYDIEGVDDIFVVSALYGAYGSQSLMLQDNGFSGTTSGGWTSIGGAQAWIPNDGLSGSSTSVAWRAALWNIGGKIFGNNGGTMFEIMRTSDTTPSGSTNAGNYQVFQYRSRTITSSANHILPTGSVSTLSVWSSVSNWQGTNVNFPKKMGNRIVMPSGATGSYLEMDASHPATFSIFNSTTPTVN